MKNKVPYNIFEKWNKDTRKKIVEVLVDGRPEDADEPDEGSDRLARPAPLSSDSVPPVRIWLDLRMSNGFYLSQKNLSYQELVRMIGRAYAECYRSEPFLLYA